MEQRPPRLGDYVDDYCPRERRVTNHAIVAIVDETVRQTRCTTCDAEHAFKGGRPPQRRARPASGADQPPVDNSGGQLVAPVPVPAAGEADEAAAAAEAADDRETAEERAAEPAAEPDTLVEERAEEVWSGHRPLIRATLPRSEGDVPPPRPIPEFTIYQRHNGRGAGGFRQGRGWQDRGVHGNGARGDRGPAGGHGQGRRQHGKKRPR